MAVVTTASKENKNQKSKEDNNISFKRKDKTFQGLHVGRPDTGIVQKIQGTVDLVLHKHLLNSVFVLPFTQIVQTAREQTDVWSDFKLNVNKWTSDLKWSRSQLLQAGFDTRWSDESLNRSKSNKPSISVIKKTCYFELLLVTQLTDYSTVKVCCFHETFRTFCCYNRVAFAVLMV